MAQAAIIEFDELGRVLIGCVGIDFIYQHRDQLLRPGRGKRPDKILLQSVRRVIFITITDVRCPYRYFTKFARGERIVGGQGEFDWPAANDGRVHAAPIANDIEPGFIWTDSLAKLDQDS